MEINRFHTRDETAAAAGEALNSLLMKNKNRPVLLLLSGGSALSILDYISASSLGENLTITMLDERFSPLEAKAQGAAASNGNLPLMELNQDPPVNNFSQLQRHDFYSLAQSAQVNFIGTLPRPGENIDDLRVRWEIALRKWREENPKGKIMATFGVGEDGHTAGIFPYPENPQFFENTFENRNWIVGYKAKGKHKYPDRVTTTLPFFKNIDEAIVFVCGEEKRHALQRLIQGKEQTHAVPALGLYETKLFQVFTDIL
ncbi:MAG: 6-phosphogluconolactonase [Candidatus Doudnabacteria bacterium]|nr:6-phosphogluconolactonase [Candidatus Doudnabacteria bacterium]